MKNKFKEHACEFKNESECEEELDLEGADVSGSEKEFYEDD